MGVGFRSRWRKIRQRRVVIAVTTAVVVVIAIIIVCIWFNGTGFNGYIQVSTIHTISGPTAGTVTRTETNQPGKTLWDLMQLLGILAIPVAVALGTTWFTTQQGKVSDAENRDNQRQNTLETYIDKMSELLLEKHLRDSLSTGEVRTIARVRTLATLSRLDGERKKTLLLFLKEAGLMKKEKGNLDLEGADFSDAQLSGEKLMFVNLSGAILMNADLSRAKLFGADLSRTFLALANLNHAELMRADLSGAELTAANLSGANLTGACLRSASLYGANLKGAIGISPEELVRQASSLTKAIMPDGSIHS